MRPKYKASENNVAPTMVMIMCDRDVHNHQNNMSMLLLSLFKLISGWEKWKPDWQNATRQTDIYNQLRAWQDPLTHNYAKHADPGNDADIADHADHTTCADPADHVDQAVGRTFTIRLRLTGAPDPTGRCHLQGPCTLLTRHSWKKSIQSP